MSDRLASPLIRIDRLLTTKNTPNMSDRARGNEGRMPDIAGAITILSLTSTAVGFGGALGCTLRTGLPVAAGIAKIRAQRAALVTLTAPHIDRAREGLATKTQALRDALAARRVTTVRLDEGAEAEEGVEEPIEPAPEKMRMSPEQSQGWDAWLEAARTTAVEICRAKGEVSTDDLWDICPPPSFVDPRVLGAVWQPRSSWQLVAHRMSEREVNHGRRIAVWRLVEDVRPAPVSDQQAAQRRVV